MLNDFKPAASQTVAFQFFAVGDALPDFDVEVLVMLADGSVSLARRIKPTNPGMLLWYSPAKCMSPTSVTHWAVPRGAPAEPVAAKAFGSELDDLQFELDLTEDSDPAEVQAAAMVEIAAWMPTLAAALCAQADTDKLADWADTFSAAQRA